MINEYYTLVKPDDIEINSAIFKHGDVAALKIWGGAYLKTTKFNPIVFPDGRTRQILGECYFTDIPGDRERISIHTKPDQSVTIVKSKFITGINKKSGKRYYRWRTEAITSLFKTSRGNFNVLRRVRGKRRPGEQSQLRFTTTVAKTAFFDRNIFDIDPAFHLWTSSKSETNGLSDPQDIINEAVKMVFGKEIGITDIMPVLKNFNRNLIFRKETHPSALGKYRNHDINRLIGGIPAKHLYTDDPRGYIKHCLGFYSKAAYRVVFNSERALSTKTLTDLGKCNIAPDWKIKILNIISSEGNISPLNPEYLNTVFDVLDSNQQKSMLKKIVADLEFDSYAMYTRDALVMLAEIVRRDGDISRIIKGRDMKEIHDDASVMYRELRHKDFDIKCWDNYPELNMSAGEVDWYLADRAHDLLRWGERFNHCIASYTGSISENEVFGVVRRNGKELGNFHIKDKQLVQFYGTNNTHVERIDPEAADTFVKHLQAAGYKA